MSQAELAINGYELVNCIATGSASQVWEAKQTASGQTFAMKLLLPEALSDAEHRATMKHEASVVKQLDHPNIIRFVESRVTRKYGYIVMELFRSVNLKSLIRGDLDATHIRLRRIMECASQAFAHMHEKNWLHKDIKPDNLLVTKGGELRVIDFSLAGKPSSSVGRIMSRKKNIAIQGTRSYISPEQIKREKITKASDIYSFGVLFYEALTGRPPFMGRNPNELLMAHVRDRPDVPSSYHPNVSSEADALVMRMLAKKPKDRPESMQQIFSEVRSLKLFKQDPETYQKERIAREEKERFVGIDQRLDSREDAAKTELHGYQPMKAPPAKPAQAAKPEPKQPAAQTGPPPGAAPQQPQQPGMFPGYHPGMQPMQMPQMMPPQMYPQQPGAPMMGAPYPPGFPGGPPHPSMPQQPQQPQQQQPTQQQPTQQQPTQQQPTQQPQPPAQPPVPQPPQQPAAGNAQEEKKLDVPDNLDWLSVS